MKKMSRREFLLRRAPAVAAGTALGLAINNDRQRIAETVMHRQAVDFEAEGHHFRGVFYMHGDGKILRQAPVPAADLVYPTIVLETGTNRYLQPMIFDGIEYPFGETMVNWLSASRSDGESKIDTLVAKLVASGEHRLVYADVPFQTEAVLIELLTAAGTVFGHAFFNAQRKFSRRTSLKILTTGLGVWGAIGVMRQFLFLAEGSAPDAVDQVLAGINYLADLSHPESLLRTLRETIVAVKTLDLDTDANLVFGKGHWTMPFHLQAGQQAQLAYLRALPKVFIDAMVSDKRYLYTSLLTERTSEGQIRQREIIHPELYRIFGPDSSSDLILEDEKNSVG